MDYIERQEHLDDHLDDREQEQHHKKSHLELLGLLAVVFIVAVALITRHICKWRNSRHAKCVIDEEKTTGQYSRAAAPTIRPPSAAYMPIFNREKSIK